MKVDAASEIFRGVNLQWKPHVFSPAMIGAATSDSALWAQQTGDQFGAFPIAAQVQSEAWAAMQRISLYRQSVGSVGVPEAVVQSGELAASMLNMVISPPEDIEALMLELADVSIGVITNVLSVYPIVGAIAGVIGSVVKAVIFVRTMDQGGVQQFFQPLTDYNVGAEEVVMSSTLPLLGTSDWTSLFLPRVGGGVHIEGREGVCPSWVMMSDERVGATGFVPGGRGIMGPIQAMFRHMVNPKQGDWCNNKEIHYRDVGDFYPSAAQLLIGVSGQVQKPGTALWSIRPDVIMQEWQDHFDEVIKQATKWWEGTDLSGSSLESASTDNRHRVIQALLAPYFGTKLDGQEWTRGLFSSTWRPGRERDMENLVDKMVRPWCEAVARRQRYFLGTTAVAYGDSAGGGFKDPELRAEMDDMRRLLLDSPARRDVVLEDVVDRDYREELFRRTIGNTLATPTHPRRDGAAPARLEGVDMGPEDPPVPPTGGTPLELVPPRPERMALKKKGKGATVAKVALGVGAAAAAGYIFTRRRSSRG